MKKTLVFIIVLIFCVKMFAAKPSIAVIRFKTVNINAAYSEAVSDYLLTYIVQSAKYSVYERNHLDRVVSEARLSASDLALRKNAVKIGRLISAKGIITGSVIKLGNIITISARLIEVHSGRVVRSEVITIKAPNQLAASCKIIAYKLIKASLSASEMALPAPVSANTLALSQSFPSARPAQGTNSQVRNAQTSAVAQTGIEQNVWNVREEYYRKACMGIWSLIQPSLNRSFHLIIKKGGRAVIVRLFKRRGVVLRQSIRHSGYEVSRNAIVFSAGRIKYTYQILFFSGNMLILKAPNSEKRLAFKRIKRRIYRAAMGKWKGNINNVEIELDFMQGRNLRLSFRNTLNGRQFSFFAKYLFLGDELIVRPIRGRRIRAIKIFNISSAKMVILSNGEAAARIVLFKDSRN